MTEPQRMLRTLPFWLMFLASLLGVTSNSATTPNIPLFVDQVLAGGPGLSGVLIALTSVSSVVSMPLSGVLADRYGYRRVAMIGALISASSLLLLFVFPTVLGSAISRLLFGIGNSAVTILSLTTLMSLTAPAQRGKVLSVFGLSVWIGFALGPQITALVNEASGPSTVFLVCAGLELGLGALFLLLPRNLSLGVQPATSPTGARGLSHLWAAIRSVWSPGIGAAVAWCAEGLMLGFLIIHLVGAGVPASGVTGAATIFSVFAGSVIVSRLFLAGLPDRIGPLRTVTLSLSILAGGLVVFAFSASFTVAVIGAILVGVGFSPLYPSLTMLASTGLTPSNRGLGLGLFGSFTSIGFASGGLLGGLVLSVSSSMWAFLIAAALQLVGLTIVVVFRRADRIDPDQRGGAQPRV